MCQTVLLLDLNPIDQLDLLSHQKIEACDDLLCNMELLCGVVVFEMDRVDLPICAHTEGVDNFEEGGVVHFLLDSFKAENDLDVFLFCLETVLFEEGEDVFGLEDGVVTGEVLKKDEWMEEVKCS